MPGQGASRAQAPPQGCRHLPITAPATETALQPAAIASPNFTPITPFCHQPDISYQGLLAPPSPRRPQ